MSAPTGLVRGCLHSNIHKTKNSTSKFLTEPSRRHLVRTQALFTIYRIAQISWDASPTNPTTTKDVSKAVKAIFSPNVESLSAGSSTRLPRPLEDHRKTRDDPWRIPGRLCRTRRNRTRKTLALRCRRRSLGSAFR